MSKLIDLINLIRPRPAMYIGSKSLSCFRSYLYGWCHRNTDEETGQEILHEFTKWLQDYFDMGDQGIWYRIILFYADNDASALDDFFSLFDEFIEDRQGKHTIDTAPKIN